MAESVLDRSPGRARAVAAVATLAITAALAGSAMAQSYDFEVGFSTYFGGSQDEEARAIRVTDDGALLIGGQTHSANLPVTAGAIQSTYAGEPAGSGHPGQVGGDLFLLRLAGDGSTVEAATYLGSSKQERNTYGFELAPDGNLIVSSISRGNDFPTTAGAYQTNYGGGSADSVVAKVSPDLETLIWSTYVGGNGEDWARGGIALTPEGDVILVGRTSSSNFHARGGAYASPSSGWDANVIKLAGDGGSLEWVSRFGGSGNEALIGTAVGDNGQIYVFGHTWSSNFPTTAGAFQSSRSGDVDAFITSLAADGSLTYATYLGGSVGEFAEHRPLLNDDGSLILTGFTNSPDFPTTDNAFQSTRPGNATGFIAQLNADGSDLDWATYLGGSGTEVFLYPTRDGSGNIMFVGGTSSTNFPVTDNALQKTYGGGPEDGVFGIISADGSELLYATYIGGSGEDLIRGLELGPNGEVYLVGKTNSNNFLTTENAAYRNRTGGFDAFVIQLVPEPGSGMLLVPGGLALLRRRRTGAQGHIAASQRMPARRGRPAED
ncbi:MAG: hypothetical protein WD009_03430 [Phycisphaeraceae bacterium]